MRYFHHCAIKLTHTDWSGAVIFLVIALLSVIFYWSMRKRYVYLYLPSSPSSHPSSFFLLSLLSFCIPSPSLPSSPTALYPASTCPNPSSSPAHTLTPQNPPSPNPPPNHNRHNQTSPRSLPNRHPRSHPPNGRKRLVRIHRNRNLRKMVTWKSRL